MAPMDRKLVMVISKRDLVPKKGQKASPEKKLDEIRADKSPEEGENPLEFSQDQNTVPLAGSDHAGRRHFGNKLEELKYKHIEDSLLLAEDTLLCDEQPPDERAPDESPPHSTRKIQRDQNAEDQKLEIFESRISTPDP